ncbi:hypothetical protein P8452_61970 [Trifolium repens]|nr:hypothetical protein P8452_61970 [Trifolium repens]
METKFEEPNCNQNENSCEALDTESGSSYVDYGLVRIPINGVEEMGGVNFKQFTPTDIMNYDFPNLEVAFTFYN